MSTIFSGVQNQNGWSGINSDNLPPLSVEPAIAANIRKIFEGEMVGVVGFYKQLQNLEVTDAFIYEFSSSNDVIDIQSAIARLHPIQKEQFFKLVMS